jgi:transcription elongation GreA/GreB family factor
MDSPVARKIAGLGKGDTFEQNGRAVTLKDVY